MNICSSAYRYFTFSFGNGLSRDIYPLGRKKYVDVVEDIFTSKAPLGVWGFQLLIKLHYFHCLLHIVHPQYIGTLLQRYHIECRGAV